MICSQQTSPPLQYQFRIRVKVCYRWFLASSSATLTQSVWIKADRKSEQTSKVSTQRITLISPKHSDPARCCACSCPRVSAFLSPQNSGRGCNPKPFKVSSSIHFICSTKPQHYPLQPTTFQSYCHVFDFTQKCLKSAVSV